MIALAHDPACRCEPCRRVKAHSVDITQADREALAEQWAWWISQGDGEVLKLKAGENGAPGSPRWVALQAIARTRLGRTLPRSNNCD